jgi:hypothetical protein
MDGWEICVIKWILADDVLMEEFRVLLYSCVTDAGHHQFVDEAIALLREYCVYAINCQQELMRLIEFGTTSPWSVGFGVASEFMRKTPFWGRYDELRRRGQSYVPSVQLVANHTEILERGVVQMIESFKSRHKLIHDFSILEFGSG